MAPSKVLDVDNVTDISAISALEDSVTDLIPIFPTSTVGSTNIACLNILTAVATSTSDQQVSKAVSLILAKIFGSIRSDADAYCVNKVYIGTGIYSILRLASIENENKKVKFLEKLIQYFVKNNKLYFNLSLCDDAYADQIKRLNQFFTDVNLIIETKYDGIIPTKVLSLLTKLSINESLILARAYPLIDDGSTALPTLDEIIRENILIQQAIIVLLEKDNKCKICN